MFLFGWGIAFELIWEWLPGIGVRCQQAYEASVCKQFFSTKIVFYKYVHSDKLFEIGRRCLSRCDIPIRNVIDPTVREFKNEIRQFMRIDFRQKFFDVIGSGHLK